MKIVSQEEAKIIDSPEGRKAWIFGFPEYEFQYDEQQPKTIIKWHHHAKIWETIYIIEGELVAKWKENREVKEQIVKAGDLIEPGYGSHTFENQSGKMVKFIAFKQILTEKNMQGMIEKDKIYD